MLVCVFYLFSSIHLGPRPLSSPQPRKWTLFCQRPSTASSDTTAVPTYVKRGGPLHSKSFSTEKSSDMTVPTERRNYLSPRCSHAPHWQSHGQSPHSRCRRPSRLRPRCGRRYLSSDRESGQATNSRGPKPGRRQIESNARKTRQVSRKGLVCES